MKSPVRHLCLLLFLISLTIYGYLKYERSNPFNGGKIGASATAREDFQAKAFPRGGPRPELLLQTGHEPYPTLATLSPDGRYVLADASASYASNQLPKLWNVASGRQIAEFDRRGMKRRLEFTPDGRHFLMACDDGAELWDIAAGHAIVQFPIKPQSETDSLGLCKLSPTGKYTLISGGGDNPRTVYLCETQTGRVIHALNGHGDEIHDCAFSRDEKKLATTAHWFTEVGGINQVKNEIMVWDITTGEFLCEIHPEQPQWFFRLAFHPDNRRLLVLADHTAKLYDTRSGAAEGLTIELDEKNYIYAAVFNSDGKYLILAHLDSFYSSEGYATLWDAQTGRKIKEIAEADTSVYPPYQRPQFSADETYLAIPNLRLGNAYMKIFHWKQQRLLHTLNLCPFYFNRIEKAKFNAEGKLVLEYEEYGESYRELHHYVGNPERIATFTLNPLHLESLQTPSEHASSSRRALLEQIGREKYPDDHTKTVLSPDGKFMVADVSNRRFSGEPDELVFFDTVQKQIIKQIQLSDFSITSLTFSSDSKYLLGGCVPPTTILWDPGTGEEIRRYVDQAVAYKLNPDWSHDYSPLAIFRPHDAKVLTNEAGDGGEVHTAVFDTMTGRRERILETLIEGDPVFSSQGDMIAVEHKILDSKTGKVLWEIPDRYLIIGFTPNGKCVLAKDPRSDLGSKHVCVLEIETARKLASIFILDDSQWIIVTPEGYFDGTENARRAVSWRIGGEVFPLELYENRFHRPDLVSLALRGQPLEEVETITGAHKPPGLALEIGKTEAEFVILKATATPGSKTARISDIRIFVDGRDIMTVQESTITRDITKDRDVVFTTKLDFPPGKTRAVAAATVTDDFGLKSQPAVMTIIRPGPTTPVERKLFVLAVGVSDYDDPQSNLRYPHADAEALVSLFQKQKNRAYDDVQSRLLINNNATAGNILQGLEWLKNNCSRADTVVIQFSGHGTRDQTGRLYYVPYGADVADVAGTFLRWDSLARSLCEVKASSILFFSDCCHAGAFGQGSASQSDLAAPLLHEARVMVFSSSKGMELSLEMGSLRHGAFSYAVLDGLNGAADLIQDGRITISELQTYVANRVKILTDDRQHPHIPLMQDFDPEMVIAYVP